MSEAFRLGVKPPSNLAPPYWISKNVRLANSERSDRFDIEQTPWFKEPLMDAGDPRVTQIVFYGPTGCGKSTMAEGLISWVTSEKPGPFLYASQTNKTAETWKESRLDYALKSCAQVKQLWPKNPHKARKTDIIFPHMPLHIRGANITNFQELSMQYLYGDEIWKWSKELLKEFLGRHHDRWNRKVFLVSQAGYKKDSMDRAFSETNQHEWFFKCDCGEHVQYQRKLIKYDRIKKKNGKIHLQKSANTARIECPHCSKIYNDNTHTRRKLSNRSKYILTKKGLEGHNGYRMHRLGIWWIPWKKYVLNELKAKRQLDMGIIDEWKQTHQKDDCVPWDDELAVTKVNVSISEMTMSERDPLAKIKGETHRFMTADKGKDHFWVVIRAWAKGERSELLFEGYIPASPNEKLMSALQDKYGVKNQFVFIDVGYEWADTHQLCADKGWIGIKGGSGTRSYKHKIKGGYEERLYSPIKYAKGSKGGRSRYIEVATDPTKDILHRLRCGTELDYSIPSDVSKIYEAHMKAEIRKEEECGKSKAVVGHWEKIKGRANHLWDCEVYNISAALIYGVFH